MDDVELSGSIPANRTTATIYTVRARLIQPPESENRAKPEIYT
jgi:hypothetical protein